MSRPRRASATPTARTSRRSRSPDAQRCSRGSRCPTVAPVTVYLVTGATGGIGRETAKALARQPDATVLVHGRSPERTAAVAAQLGGEPFVADLSSLDEVRRLADDVLARYDGIDVLVNNAGVIFARPETVFTVNHLAPFLLTHLLREH